MSDTCEKLPDLNAYLARIGLAGRALPPTLESIDLIISHHLMHIPFENLDAWGDRKAPALDLPSLFDKIVLHRRGGWCFEQNALLHALLTELGFDVYPVGVRVLVGRADTVPAVSHRGEVCVLDGRHYYCDVGFGGELFRAAIPLDGAQNPFGFFAQQKGRQNYICKNAGRPEPLLMFVDEPYVTADYEYPNFTHAMRPGLPFREHLYVSTLTPDGHRRLLFDRTMKETCGDALISALEVTDDSALTKLLSDHFGIEYTLAAKL